MRRLCAGSCCTFCRLSDRTTARAYGAAARKFRTILHSQRHRGQAEKEESETARAKTLAADKEVEERERQVRNHLEEEVGALQADNQRLAKRVAELEKERSEEQQELAALRRKLERAQLETKRQDHAAASSTSNPISGNESSRGTDDAGILGSDNGGFANEAPPAAVTAEQRIQQLEESNRQWQQAYEYALGAASAKQTCQYAHSSY